MTTTAPAVTSPAAVRPPRWRRALRAVLTVLRRERAFAALALGATVVGWRLAHHLLYPAGLLLLVLWGASVLLRRRNRIAFALAVVAFGVGGPWLGVRLEYEPGASTPTVVNAQYWAYVATADGIPVFMNGVAAALVAVDDSGEPAWRADLPDGASLTPSADGGFLVRGVTSVARLDPRGQRAWTHPAPALSTSFVAEADDIVVTRACSDGADGTTCTWAGADRADGSTRWEVTGAPAPGWAITTVGPQGADGAFAPPGTSLFTVRAESGDVEVHTATTGAVVYEVGSRVTPLLVGDAVLAVHQANPCGAELVRDGERVWSADVLCGSWAPIAADQPAEPGAEDLWFARPRADVGGLVGDSWWSAPGAAGRVTVIDLRTGAVRYEPVADRVLGAGVEVRLSAGAISVRDPDDGTELWTARIPSDGRWVVAEGDVVVVRHEPSLLLEEVFRADAPLAVVEVYEAVTGRLRGRLPADGGIEAAGDRVVVDVTDGPVRDSPTAVVIGP